MAQHDFNIANATFPATRTDINNALSAINSTQSGTSTPSGAVAGTIWLDTTSATTPTLKYYDGTDNISLATIDHVGNTVNWLDSTVSITGLSTTATATVLTLTDSASTSTVNLIIDNQKEVRFRETTANGTNFIGLKAPASVSADLTFTLPSADGTNGQVLTTNGSGVLSFATPASGIAWQSSVKTSGFTAVAGEGYFCNTTSAGFTVTLPASPTAGQQIAVVDYAGTFDTNALNISPNGNKIEGATDNLGLSSEREGTTLVYIDSTQGWLASSGINEGTDALQALPYSADFLVIAGAGGGGGHAGSPGKSAAGGGAGGYRNSFSTETSGGGGSSETSLTFTQGIVYTITVGAGGAGGTTSPQTNGTTGTNSSISGTTITTITSSGGGGGATRDTSGLAGGSGGGAGAATGTTTGGSGTANQGFVGGGCTANADEQGSGGGGGASAVGASTSNTITGGAGGAGLASSITGSSVSRGGGGGGGGTTGGAGGTGGGASGGSAGGNGSAGSVNTGGGGGGASFGAANGGAGGKGVVILSMPLANFSGTTTGSPTESDDGTTKRLIFNDSGSYTG